MMIDKYQSVSYMLLNLILRFGHESLSFCKKNEEIY